MPIQPLEIWLLLHTEILKVYWNLHIPNTHKTIQITEFFKKMYILNDSSDQINLKKQSRKYLYNYQCLPTLENSNAKLFALDDCCHLDSIIFVPKQKKQWQWARMSEGSNIN